MTIGGLIAGVFLVLLSPPLSRWAMQFSPWEYFTMVLMAIVLILRPAGLFGGAK